MKRRTLTSLLIAFTIATITGTTKAGEQTTAYPTSYAGMVAQLKADQQRSPLVHLSTIGYSAKHRHPIVMVQLGILKSGVDRIMVLCRQHGDEPSGTEGALAAIKKLSSSKSAAKQLNSVCLFIIPMVNPDGAEAGTRLNGNLADLNRDWGIFHQPETVAIRDAVARIKPEFILDVHSWDMIDPFQQVCLEGPRDKEAAGPGLLAAIADLQARGVYALRADSGQNVAATTYGEYSEDTLAHRYFLRSDHIASLLFETAPGDNFGQSLSSRTALVESMLLWLIKDTSLHAGSWQRLAAAEPPVATTFATNQPAATQVQPSVISRPVLQKVSPQWVPLTIGCFIIGWLIMRPRQVQQVEPNRGPARYRRYAHTSHNLTAAMYVHNQTALRRKYIPRLPRIEDPKYRQEGKFNAPYQAPGTAEAV